MIKSLTSASTGFGGARCPFHRFEMRNAAFRDHDGVWWSDEQRSWMVSDPCAIAEIVNDASATVNVHRFAEIAKRAGVLLPNHAVLHEYLPVALDGPAHARLRAKFEEEISKNTARAIAVVERDFMRAIAALELSEGNVRFCVARDLVNSPIRAGNLALAGVDICDVDDLESLPLFFDKGLSLKRRRQLEDIMDCVITTLPMSMSKEEKYFRIAFLALSMNTPLGAILQSIFFIVTRNAGVKLKDMDWDVDLPATALPVLERRLVADLAIGTTAMKAGDRVQLFLGVVGDDERCGPKYSALYFGGGPHKCPGMNYSRRIWKILTDHLKVIDRKWDVLAASCRPDDMNFDLIEQFEVESHD